MGKPKLDFRLRDSGNGGMWRSAAQVPEYVAEESAPEEDYVQRQNQKLWSRSRISIDQLRETRQPAREEDSCKAANATWDLAVAFAIHALGLERGPDRDRAEEQCLDALEVSISAGHERPAPDHPDFTCVSDSPRFLALTATDQRSSA